MLSNNILGFLEPDQQPFVLGDVMTLTRRCCAEIGTAVDIGTKKLEYKKKVELFCNATRLAH